MQFVRFEYGIEKVFLKTPPYLHPPKEKSQRKHMNADQPTKQNMENTNESEIRRIYWMQSKIKFSIVNSANSRREKLCGNLSGLDLW